MSESKWVETARFPAADAAAAAGIDDRRRSASRPTRMIAGRAKG